MTTAPDAAPRCRVRRTAASAGPLGAVAALGVLALAVPSSPSAAASCAGGGPCLVAKVLDGRARCSRRASSAATTSTDPPRPRQSTACGEASGAVHDSVCAGRPAVDRCHRDVGSPFPGTTTPRYRARTALATADQQQLAAPADNGFVDGRVLPVYRGQRADVLRPRRSSPATPTMRTSTLFGILTRPRPLVVLFTPRARSCTPTITVDHAEARAGTLDTFRATFPAADGAPARGADLHLAHHTE